MQQARLSRLRPGLSINLSQREAQMTWEEVHDEGLERLWGMYHFLLDNKADHSTRYPDFSRA